MFHHEDLCVENLPQFPCKQDGQGHLAELLDLYYISVFKDQLTESGANDNAHKPDMAIPNTIQSEQSVVMV